MKKLFTIIALLIATVTFAQSEDSTQTKITGYASVSVSVTNGDNFLNTSYGSVEGGIMCKNFGLGLVLGRGTLAGMGKSTDNIKNYFYEIKTSASYPIGILSGNIILGYGGYINTIHNFIEYGVGMSYSVRKMGYGVTYSNWDGVNYITPCITLNF